MKLQRLLLVVTVFAASCILPAAAYAQTATDNCLNDGQYACSGTDVCIGSPIPTCQAATTCLDTGCSDGYICKGSPPTCQVNAATCNPACGGSTPICDTSTGQPICISQAQYGDQTVPGIPANAGTPGVNGTQAGGSGINPTYLNNYKNGILSAVNTILLPVLVAIAFIVFLWGVVNAYIIKSASEDARKQGHQLILWGIIGFVIIFSLWGIVNIVASTFGLPGGGSAAQQGLTPPSL